MYVLRSTIADCNCRFALVVGKTLSRRVSRGDRRVLKQSSPQISVASRLLSPVPKSHPHTLKTSRAACVRGGAQSVSWPATYLHPNIKPLRLVPIILDKRQDSMMYCHVACRAFPPFGPWSVPNICRYKLMRKAIEEFRCPIINYVTYLAVIKN